MPNGPALVVLSNRLWQRRYGADPGVAGRAIYLQSAPFTVVGVLPERFELLLPPEAFQIDNADVWIPQRGNLRAVPRNLTGLSVIGRLKPGVTLAQAQSELDGSQRSFAPSTWCIAPRACGSARYPISTMS